MSSSLRLFHQVVPVTENIRLAEDTYRIRTDFPQLAQAIRPGQFVMMRLPATTDPLLGRPLALYDTVVDGSGQATGLDIVYLVVGKLTGRLAGLRTGDPVEVWGPLGNGFFEMKGGHVALVAGGIGQTPFLAYARDLLGQRNYAGRPARRQVESVTLFYGVRTASLAAGVDDFLQAGVQVHVASDDGSLGFRGFVTDLVAQTSAPDQLVGCGPEPMMRALADLARRWNVPCQLSLETPMACGLGVCFSCVARVMTQQGWDYRRVCMDGPVFDAQKLIWD
jgi:dihydroorotate dehydrogenase electron transfer subunit